MITYEGPFAHIATYKTGQAGELAQWLPVADPGPLVVVYECEFEVQAGDLLTVHSEGQCTNDRGLPTYVSSMLLLEIGVSKWELQEENGTNVEPDDHHDRVAKGGAIKCNVSGLAKVQHAWRATDNRPSLPGHAADIRVDLDYGAMMVRHERRA